MTDSVKREKSNLHNLAGLLRLFGKPIEKFIDRWFNLLSILFFAGLIGGFVVIKLFVAR